jgi:hypothetical protein
MDPSTPQDYTIEYTEATIERPDDSTTESEESNPETKTT